MDNSEKVKKLSVVDVKNIIVNKIEEAMKLTYNNTERHYLIRFIFVSAQMQGLIGGWKRMYGTDFLSYTFQIDSNTPYQIDVPLVK